MISKLRYYDYIALIVGLSVAVSIQYFFRLPGMFVWGCVLIETVIYLRYRP